ncbi:hypothetical protein [Kitasatospora sp. CB01950]|uniref:hypothetical protein n=1 Tax=Kitasatospora sp. CB01950 TaxID=1703930 RepID=UPI00093DC367|nr:hypothetical protein [Kitasatospora sp. CB01950]OKJ06610.1 hypothetical protein AMK19_22130 [Kitasatospora sp. CB01950]
MADEVRAYPGLDPEFVRDRESPVCPGPLLEPDPEDLAAPSPPTPHWPQAAADRQPPIADIGRSG